MVKLNVCSILVLDLTQLDIAYKDGKFSWLDLTGKSVKPIKHFGCNGVPSVNVKAKKVPSGKIKFLGLIWFRSTISKTAPN